jgi:predicted lipoprotein
VLCVFVDPAFETKTPKERNFAYAQLQAAAARQGYAGEVAAVWEDPDGRMQVLAPAQQQPFFEAMQYAQLRAQINGTLEL